MSFDRLFIDNDDVLKEWLNTLEDSDVVGIDTEFMRVNTYFPKLCLVQISTKNTLACIDILNIHEKSLLKPLLVNPKIVKIFHSSSQDLEAFVSNLGVIPAPIFDTQVAESILGSEHPLSYRDTVESYFEVILEKSETRTDWSRRPLTIEQIDYAYKDIEYLLPLYEILLERLSDSELKEMTIRMKFLTIYENYLPKPEMAWKKVKKYRTLRGKRLALLKLLAAEREKIAIEYNLPKRWVVDDEVLLSVANHYEVMTIETLLSKIEKAPYASRFFEIVQLYLAEA